MAPYLFDCQEGTEVGSVPAAVVSSQRSRGAMKGGNWPGRSLGEGDVPFHVMLARLA